MYRCNLVHYKSLESNCECNGRNSACNVRRGKESFVVFLFFSFSYDHAAAYYRNSFCLGWVRKRRWVDGFQSCFCFCFFFFLTLRFARSRDGSWDGRKASGHLVRVQRGLQPLVHGGHARRKSERASRTHADLLSRSPLLVRRMGQKWILAG